MMQFLADIGRFRRWAWELLASILIALGVVMMMQPWVMDIYTYSFLVTLVGTVSFIVATKFPE
jgi:hypothetical protein